MAAAFLVGAVVLALALASGPPTPPLQPPPDSPLLMDEEEEETSPPPPPLCPLSSRKEDEEEMPWSRPSPGAPPPIPSSRFFFLKAWMISSISSPPLGQSGMPSPRLPAEIKEELVPGHRNFLGLKRGGMVGSLCFVDMSERKRRRMKKGLNFY